jgi:hypothetical protein
MKAKMRSHSLDTGMEVKISNKVNGSTYINELTFGIFNIIPTVSMTLLRLTVCRILHTLLMSQMIPTWKEPCITDLFGFPTPPREWIIVAHDKKSKHIEALSDIPED